MKISNQPSGSSVIELKYVNWDIEFTQGASDRDKAVAMDSIRRHILYNLAQQDFTGHILKQITFNWPDFTGRDRTTVGVSISLSNAAGDAIAPPKLGGGPHRFTLLAPGNSIIPNTISIKDAGTE